MPLGTFWGPELLFWFALAAFVVVLCSFGPHSRTANGHECCLWFRCGTCHMTHKFVGYIDRVGHNLHSTRGAGRCLIQRCVTVTARSTQSPLQFVQLVLPLFGPSSEERACRAIFMLAEPRRPLLEAMPSYPWNGRIFPF